MKKTIQNEFDINLNQLIKNRHYYIAYTNKGIYNLQPTNLSEDMLKKIHNIKEELAKNGYEFTDRFILTKENKPFFVYEGEKYVLTKKSDKKEMSYTNEKDVFKTAEFLAKFHSCSKNLFIKEETHEFFIPFKKKCDKLKFVKKHSNNKKMSDFDVIFIKTYNRFLEQSQYALNVMENIKTIQTNYLCHNLLKEENILIDNKCVYFTDFSKCSQNNFVFDLAYFLKRYYRKNNGIVSNLEKIIEIYNKYNPIDANELNLLNAIMIFPERYIEICDNYYCQKKHLIPNSVLTNLKNTIELNSITEQFPKSIIKNAN